MNSEVINPTLSLATPIRTPRPILILTAVYVALLAVIGIMMWANDKDDGWFFPLSTAFLPALVYATGTFVYGCTLFGNAGLAARARAWSNLLWITVFLYATVAVIAGPWRDKYWREEYLPIGVELFAAITIVLLALWRQIGSTVFILEGPSHSSTSLAAAPRARTFIPGGWRDDALQPRARCRV